MDRAETSKVLGLVLTGGGARAAYQVGALKAIAELTDSVELPFQVLAGVSAGSINVASVASRAANFSEGVEQLWRTWQSLTPGSVYRTDVRSLGPIGVRWLKQVIGGGFFGEGSTNHLLDTAPLRALLQRKLLMSRMADYLAQGQLRGVSFTSTNYQSGSAITFFDGAPSIEPWTRSMRMGKRAILTVDHVMASAALPFFFPPIRIGQAFFGDGGIRLSSPLSPAVHLGAERILAIGIRHVLSAGQTAERNRPDQYRAPAFSEIAGLVINAVFLDALEGDAERLERINRTLALMTPEQRVRLTQPLRRIPILVLRPSRDLGRLAEHQVKHFPRTLRYLFRGIGVTGKRGGDLMSYLAFEPEYIGKLLELGYQDTMQRRLEVATFFQDAEPHIGELRADAESWAGHVS